MSYPYAKRLPQDSTNNTMQGYPPAFPALQVSGYAPPAASSVITFNANTTVIEITALNASLAYKWGPDSVIATAGATANFDGIVPVNSTKRLVVPVSVIATNAGSSILGGAGPQNGLYRSMAVIATASVLTAITEY